MKYTHLILLLGFFSLFAWEELSAAGKGPLIYQQEPGLISFAVDDVAVDTGYLHHSDGLSIALRLIEERATTNPFSFYDRDGHRAEILTCSFAGDSLSSSREDVLYEMLMDAWRLHKPVVLSPDAVWLVIAQGLSYHINAHPEEYRDLLVQHQGKELLSVQSQKEILTEQADWYDIIEGFVSEIGKKTSAAITPSLIADFTTTGREERLVSAVTLMDVVKPFFDYEVFYIACGIPFVTLTGTPDDWRKLLDKTQTLRNFGLAWWADDLEPILSECIKASEGNPDISFWKDMVMKSRPGNIQGPTCSRRKIKKTEFDGWFLKLFPFNSYGERHGKTTIDQAMLRETVCVPFKYVVKDAAGGILSESEMEIVAGIVGYVEDKNTHALSPRIGWFVRKISKVSEKRRGRSNNWGDGLLRLEDFAIPDTVSSKVFNLQYELYSSFGEEKWGNTRISFPFLTARIDRKASFIDTAYRNDSTLLYLQTAFDLVELNARRAERAFLNERSYLNTSNMGDLSSRMARHVAAYKDSTRADIAEFEEQSHEGTDMDVVRNYSARVQEQLAQLPVTKPDPDMMISPRGFIWGAYLGVSADAFLGGPARSYSRGAILFDVASEIGYNRYGLNLGLHLGRKRQAFLVSAGYTVFDSQEWKITPLIGCGIGGLAIPDEIDGYSCQLGLSADRKLFRDINALSMDRSKGAGFYLGEIVLKTKLYVVRTAFPAPIGTAWSLNLGFSVGFSQRTSSFQ